MTQLYVACLKLEKQPVLVVGGGVIATGKVESLLACGATVTVVAPRASARVAELAVEGTVTWHARGYESSDLDGVLLVVASTDDHDLHVRIHAEASARRTLVNIVDDPQRCTFIVPALHREGPITVAVSSSGASPALAKRLRDEIAVEFGAAWGQLAVRLQAERAWARETLATYQDRQAFFESIILGDPDPIILIEKGEMSEIENLIELRRTQALES
jgi:precorrin-2 dehydrogenase / sirohydrochlorin ferrochelatase